MRPRDLLPLLSLLLAAQAPAPPAGEALLRQVMARLAAVPARQARFVEEKRLAALTAPLRSEGVIVYRRPDYLERRTTAPHAEELVLDRHFLRLTRAGHPARDLDLQRQPGLDLLAAGLRAPLAGDLETLERAFRVEASGSVADWRITLTPRAGAAARFVRTIALRGGDDAVREIDVTQGNGDLDRTVMVPE